MSNNIFVNQIGYSPKQNKQAFVRASGFASASEFSLVDSKNNTVFTEKLKLCPEDPLTNEQIYLADFSSFQTEGEYTLNVEGLASFPFKIGTNIYNDLYYSILNYFYLSRCCEDIPESKAGIWAHPACHATVAEIYGTNQTKLVTGGWHDAGDYGRYVIAATKTIMDLLLAYQQSKDTYNGFDILSEVRFELEWLLQMQRDDGAVYHKISCYHFCAFIMPHEEKDKVVISPVSTAATADFAGCLAFSYNFFKDTDSKFAETLLKAAIKAQDYLDSHEDELYRNPEEITTGGYGDWNVKDERYFALCSLFTVTKDEKYLSKAKEIREYALSLPEAEEPWKKNWFTAFSWGCVSGYGTEILLTNKELIPQTQEYQDFLAQLQAEIIKTANVILDLCNKSDFSVGLRMTFWGSNGHVCDNAHMLLLANDLQPNPEYVKAAENQLNYLLGCNPLDLCYVTGNGSNSPKKPHHRPSGSLKNTMPGMLTGGPSQGLQDQTAKKYLEGKAPLQCYIDKEESYSTNEIAIYWNSPLVYVIAKLKKI